MIPLFGPPPSPIVIWVVIGFLVVAVAIPFGRRDDWIGWTAFLAIALAAIGMWVLLIWGWTRAFIEWWRKRSGTEVEKD